MAAEQQPDPMATLDRTGAADQGATPAGTTGIGPMQAPAEPAEETAARATAQVSRTADLVREGLGRTVEWQNRTRDSLQGMMQMGLESLASSAREINGQVSRTFGFDHEDGERLSGRWLQNTEAVTRCGTVMSHALHDAWRGYVALGQKQWQRNVESLNRLAQSRSVQELTLVQSEIARESLHGLVVDSRTVAEQTLRAFEEAGRICSSVQPPTLVR